MCSKCVANMSNYDLTEYNLIKDKRVRKHHCIIYKLVDRGLVRIASCIISKRHEINMHKDGILKYVCKNCNYLKLIQTVVDHPNTVIYIVSSQYGEICSNIGNYSNKKKKLEIILKSKKVSKHAQMREYRLKKLFYDKIGINPMDY